MCSQNTKAIRIVSVDHYMSKPDSQYDVCYSRFRGSEIRQVPVIRLFGTTADGTHSCVHIHGVFPYFYIPYEGSTGDRIEVDRQIYQLSTALDKAINVSLARSMSRATHIFKVVLVKGIPIYGYHHNEHNYLKIYMYNPLLVRTATTLLMNGAIPSIRPQVHETHIPYVLQFFIDYNLYGMSFLHVNANGLRQRNAAIGSDEDAMIPPKMSTCEYEIDVLASDILNREPDENDTGEFANPGIASIWKDEELRRLLLGQERPEKKNLSQDDGSSLEVVTESDRFYRAMLATKLSKDQVTTSSTETHQKPSFPFIYPTETTEGLPMLNASHIVDHGRTREHTNESLYNSQISYCFDASVKIDEEKVVFASQNQQINASLREEDYNLLEIMRELEENEKRNFEGDCLLAPLTQSGEHNRSIVQGCSASGPNVSQISKRLNASLSGDLEALHLMQQLEQAGADEGRNDSFDSDDEFLLDLTQKQQSVRNIDIDGLSGYLNDSGDEDLLSGGCIPQLDGGDDQVASRTPKRNRKPNEFTPEISSLPKRIRIDLTQPASRKPHTPRKVTFAPSPPENGNDNRGDMIKKQFEVISPNTLRKCEIRVSKLGLFKKSILSNKSVLGSEKMQQEMPLKNLRIRLTKLDASSLEMIKTSETCVHERYRQAYEYDKRNNFNPLEGPSTLKSNRVRKTEAYETAEGQSTPKRSKLEEQQEIELLLSERFKNIIRLSPKVLIKPLSKGDENVAKSGKLTVSNATKARTQPTPAFDKCITVTVEDDKTDSKPADAISEIPTLEIGKSSAAETIPPIEIIDSDESFEHPHEVEDIRDDMVIDLSDTNVGEKASTTSSPVRSEEPMVTIHLVSEDGFDPNISQDSASSAAKETPQIASSVSISIQLDGAVEPMDGKTGAEAIESQLRAEVDEEENSTYIQSFCETTMVCDVDDIGSDSDDSCRVVSPEERSETGDDIPNKISLDASPPTRDQALLAIESFEIPAVINATPFYSNPDDVTGKKEIGHTVLQIPGNSLNNLEEFKSSIAGLQSIKSLRYEILKQTYGENIDHELGSVGTNGPNADQMKQLLASELLVTITLSTAPPTRAEADAWLDERIRNRRPDQHFGKVDAMELDSPIKVKKAEAVMTIEQSEENASSTQTKIDSESAMNLSVLLTNEGEKTAIIGPSTKSLVSKIMTMNTFKSGSHPILSKSGESADAVVTEAGATLASYSVRQKHRKVRNTSREPSETIDVSQASPVPLDEVAEVADAITSASKTIQKHTDPVSVQPDKDAHSGQKDADETQGPFAMASSDQSDVIEQTNANISMAMAPENAYGFKVDYENLQQAKPGCEYNYLTVLAVEIHVPTRGDLRPNPTADPIGAIFYRIQNDVPPDHPRSSSVCGVILNQDLGGPFADETTSHKYNQSAYVADVVKVCGERELYEKFLLLIAFWDPDIFTGYEIESVSWGYIIERGYALDMNLMKMLSRVPTAEKVHVSEEEQQELLEMHDYSAGLKIPGRILLDIWRLMRHEIALTSYTFENMAYHILHRRVPSHSYRQLSRLWNTPYSCWIVLDYYLERVNGNFEILNQLDLIGRTAELAKLFGIQFYEVLSRGSQFRVESMMLRIAKPRNFVSVSPTIQQRAHMRAPEYLPLIMEPNSRFYADPIIVLDFQSLYPSVIIAYNYCFSTCLGRIEHLAESSEEFEFGASQLRIPPKMLKTLMEKNLITCSPCGIAFVKTRVREGVLPRMLSEILNTRLMVKKSMKMHKDNSVLQRVLHSRQLGLKLIANVTYGYTAANFSGRMPCVEIGDSVVAKGRETLERAIKLVEGTERWGAKVVYGDTDSLFVLCPGRTRAEAFRIGEEIAETVTKANPPPVKLKLEKVYQPSILQTKKRYVGYMYETADQEKPTYEAKGIETVRRDGCPVVAKMLEKVLRILFETCDVSKVKQYTCRQFTKILEGRVNLQDFIFAKEFRGENGYKPGACVPALELSRKWKLMDPRKEPRKGQRVPYVIINGPPLVPLIRLVRSPDEVLADEGLKINANYYISKAIIPPLNRCLLLIGANVQQWYNDLPRKTLMLHNTGGIVGTVCTKIDGSSSGDHQQQVPKKSTISQYFSTTSCIVDCGRQTQHGICKDCKQRPQYAMLHVVNKISKLERKVELTEKMCRSCCQRSFETFCNSLDCPVMFALNRRQVEYKQTQYYRDLLEQFF